MTSRRLILTGGTSLIGDYLIPRLLASGYQIQGLIRTASRDNQPGITWHTADISNDLTLPLLSEAYFAIHLAPLWLLPKLIPVLAEKGVKRLIAFGSTSCFTKLQSADPEERKVAENLLTAELEIQQLCNEHEIHWTLFRPTLIYANDVNALGKALAPVARFIHYAGFFPLIDKAEGLRRPVHAEDLASACLQALEVPATYRRAYNLSGAEVLPYRGMIERLFHHLGKQPRFVKLPRSIIRAGIHCLRFVPAYQFLNLEMADRMNQHMDFDHVEAARDFAYTPRKFLA